MRKALALVTLLALVMVIGMSGLLAQEPEEPVEKDTAAAPAEEPAETEAEAEAEADAPAHDYVGAKKCKICHKAEHDSWLNTGHAKAWDLLKADEKKNEECVGCHTTGVTAKGEMLEGVQCEACHGPGADYRKTKIMKDKKLALENGMIEPTAEVCTTCHNEKSPTFKGFDFDKYVVNPAGVHAHPEKKEKEKE